MTNGESPTVKDPAKDPVAVQAAIDKAVAEARSAVAKAESEERDAAEKNSLASRQERAAALRQKTAEAEAATATARRNQVAAFIPDFSKAERGTLDVKEGSSLFGPALAQRATDVAADRIVDAAKSALPADGTWRVLVTSDAELASSHAAYLSVVTGLDQLTDAATNVLVEVEKEPTTEEAAGLAAPAIAALAGAVPGLLSLFSAHRGLSTAPVTVEDLSAAAAAAGALKRHATTGVVIHDDVRLLKSGGVHTRLNTLSMKGRELVAKKIALEDEKAVANSKLERVAHEIKSLAARLEEAEPTAKEGLRTALERAQGQTGPLERAIAAAGVRAELIVDLLEAINAFINALTGVPEGEARSPLTLAALRERLHDVGDEAPDRFTHVLFVKGNGGSATQATDDRPFWFKDRFAVVAMASITYMLIDTKDSQILAAGNAGGSAAGNGKIGHEFEINVRTNPLG